VFLAEVIEDKENIDGVLEEPSLDLAPAARQAFSDWRDECRKVQREAERLEVDGCWYLYHLYFAAESHCSERSNAAKAMMQTDMGGANLDSIRAAADSMTAWIRESVQIRWRITEEHEPSSVMRQPVPGNELLRTLQQRFVDAAVDHAELQVVLYVGRSDAFPLELCRGDEPAAMSWPAIEPRGLVPIHTHTMGLGDRLEVLAFFGGRAALNRLESLSLAAIGAIDEYAVPHEHDLAESKHPHWAWVRWLFDRFREELEYHIVCWSKRSAKGTYNIQSKDAAAFDPLNTPIPTLYRKRGPREWGCLAFRLRKSVFAVSAQAIESRPAPKRQERLQACEDPALTDTGLRTAIVRPSTGPTESEAVREITKVTLARGQDTLVLRASSLPRFPIPTNYSELFKLFAAKVACGSPHERVGLLELNHSVGAEESPSNSERASAPLRTAVKRLNDELSRWAPWNDQGSWIRSRRRHGYYLAENVEWHIDDPGLEEELRRYSQSVWGINVAPATIEENTPLKDQRLPGKPRHVSPPDRDD
jgi:hypothetical protein